MLLRHVEIPKIHVQATVLTGNAWLFNGRDLLTINYYEVISEFIDVKANSIFRKSCVLSKMVEKHYEYTIRCMGTPSCFSIIFAKRETTLVTSCLLPLMTTMSVLKGSNIKKKKKKKDLLHG